MEKAMVPHSSTLAWKILWREEPGRLQSMDTTERLHFHFSLSCIGEGNGNPLQCSCLENPREGGAWWAAVYGVAQGRTWLKWLSSRCTITSSTTGKKKTTSRQLWFTGLLRWFSGKESTCQAGDSGLIPGSGRSPREGNGNTLRYFCLENPMDRGAWQATVLGVLRVRHAWCSTKGMSYLLLNLIV